MVGNCIFFLISKYILDSGAEKLSEELSFICDKTESKIIDPFVAAQTPVHFYVATLNGDKEGAKIMSVGGQVICLNFVWNFNIKN